MSRIPVPSSPESRFSRTFLSRISWEQRYTYEVDKKSGILCYCLGLVPWGLWTLFDSTRTWFLASDVPLTLSKGSHYTTGMVKTNMSALYSI
jgi:hypothetical protein